MGQMNSGGRVRKTLDYLVRDYQNTVSDVENVGKYALRKALPVVLAVAMPFVSIGCPWQKDKDNDTSSGSSGTPVCASTLEYLTDADFDDGINPNYGKDTTSIVSKRIYTNSKGRAPASINTTFKNGNGCLSYYDMFRDTSVITETLKDEDFTNGELYTTANINLPITGTYTFKVDATDGVSGWASTRYANHLTVLTPEGHTAWQLRRGQAGVYLNSAGMSATALAPVKRETDELSDWIANADSKDIYAKKFKDTLYRLDPTGAILNDETPLSMTRWEYEQLLNFKFESFTNERVADQTLDNAPIINAKITDYEVRANSGSCSLDKPNKKFWITVVDKNGVQKELIWDFTGDAEAQKVFEKVLDISVPGTYLKNIISGYNTYDANGYQIAP
jgi:hypothetical protein